MTNNMDKKESENQHNNNENKGEVNDIELFPLLVVPWR